MHGFVPFSDLALERLYYYGKYLLTKLPPPDRGAAVDLSGAVVLTHLRTDLVAERQDLSLTDGEADPLPGLPGEGRGRQVDEPKSLLSQLIDLLNERFGVGLGEADLIWFEQQQIELASDHDVRAVALHNDEEQFRVFIQPRIEQSIVDRHQPDGDLFDSYFSGGERRELVDELLIRSLYAELRSGRRPPDRTVPARRPGRVVVRVPSAARSSGGRAASVRSSTARSW